MVICFSCPHSTKQLLDELVATGEYGDHSQVIAAAVENLAMLQKALATSGALVIGDSTSDASRDASAIPVGPIDVRQSQTASSADTEASPDLLDRGQPPPESPPSLFKLNGLAGEEPPTLAELPADSWMVGEEVPLDRWTFGQFNKLLTAKASCRALAHLLCRGRTGLDLDESAQHVANEAAVLGDYLAALDSRVGHYRDEALSTAFPTTGDKAAKSRMRYANQFVGGVNKQGQLSGLLLSLKLVNWLRGSTRRLSLTKPGWDFATLPNPIFDSPRPRLDESRRFSEGELEFLLCHVAENVPVERYAYGSILKLITSGVNTPKKLDAALEHAASKASEKKPTGAFLTTQRSGAISRMVDLDLLARKRDGVKVKYLITHRGDEFLTRIKKEQKPND